MKCIHINVGVSFRLSSAPKLMQMENGQSPKEKYLHDFTYHGQELSVTEAKNVLFQHLDNNGSVDLEKDANGIAKIRLNNPRIKNAINVKMMLDLDEITEKLSQWTDCKGAIMYGADGNFCSGGDLKMAKKINNAFYGYAMSIYVGHILDKFKKLPIITVAYIDGTGAIGGGAELTTACDYRLMCNAVDTTAIGFVQSKMGIVPAWGATGRLVSIMGARKTLDLLLEARLFGVTEAMDLGLVDGAVASLADAEAWLSRKIKPDVNVIRAIKRMVRCHDDSQEAARMIESRIFAPLWGGPVNQAAIERQVKHKK
ncbi:ethylmalonyl-CoA decarboxylase-like isoform X2 [Rhopalosiphum padi]|uniref:ethylmalonyl-CoA decarboxylase-like isoform X2 n=1 Tax=Rhopalosiphum padi TaxID=40932 RepID=UPI00298E3932|nr:ethylmalonyl-CoA decarboxylase-like isoform X2 [Rhopalosiphum padi]